MFKTEVKQRAVGDLFHCQVLRKTFYVVIFIIYKSIYL